MSATGVAVALKRSADTTRKLRMVGSDHAAERQKDDFYPTPPDLTRALLAVESFEGGVWEPACGDGSMSEVLSDAGCHVVSSDLVARGYGESRRDFLMESMPAGCRHIVTNPPFKLAEQFWRRACTMAPGKVAFVARLTWLEGIERAAMFREFPPARVWVASWRPSFQRARLATAKDTGGMLAHAWYVRDPSHVGPPHLGWLSRRPEAA